MTDKARILHTFRVQDVGGCQNCGPFLGTLNIRCRIIIGIQKGTIILTTTHVMIHIVVGGILLNHRGLSSRQLVHPDLVWGTLGRNRSGGGKVTVKLTRGLSRYVEPKTGG